LTSRGEIRDLRRSEIKQDVLAFRVDFNNIDAGGLLKGSLPHASGPRRPDVGERVLLRDWEGNRCWGTVMSVGQLSVRFELDDATWVSGEEVAARGLPEDHVPEPD